MSRLIRVLVLGIALVAASTALAGSGSSTMSGLWRKLPTTKTAGRETRRLDPSARVQVGAACGNTWDRRIVAAGQVAHNGRGAT